MSSKDWRVGQIYGMGPTTDATGQPAINGTSFGVELIGHSLRLHIEVAVTSVASRPRRRQEMPRPKPNWPRSLSPYLPTPSLRKTVIIGHQFVNPD